MMKRLLILAAAMLLLCGCSEREHSGTTQLPAGTTLPQQTQADLPGIYEADSEIERSTGGALKLYLPENRAYTSLAFRGMDAMLMWDTGAAMYSGANLSLAAQTDLPADMPEWNISSKGFWYYREELHELIFLGEDLQPANRLHLPEDAVGSVAVSPEWDAVYYCTEHALRALDMSTGVPRMLYQTNQRLSGIVELFFNGEALLVCAENESGMRDYALVSTDKGSVIYRGDALISLLPGQSGYYFPVVENGKEQLVFGSDRQDVPKTIFLESGWQHVLLSEQGYLVSYRTDEAGTELKCYAFNSGKCVGAIYIEGLTDLRQIVSDAAGMVWLRCYDSTQERQLLYRWNLQVDPPADETVYTDIYYNRESPDTEGLTALRRQADILEKNYGVKILMEEQAMVAVPGDYLAETEYWTGSYQQALKQLEELLSVFPKDFFRTAGAGSKSGTLQICLLRSLTANRTGIRAGDQGLQLWKDGEMYILLQIDDCLEQNFYHQMGHVIDNRILSTCALLDQWSDLNPAGFSYTGLYTQEQGDAAYLQGESRCFADGLSMCNPTEDRAGMFALAMKAAEEESFAASAMQAKLEVLCRGIRRAFSLEEEPFVLPWEQYLK